MQSHALQIQELLARERDVHLRQVGLVRASLLTVPPRPQGPAGVAQARASR
jgi:hypothetical protein